MTNPRLVSTLEKFLRAPSSDGFIELLSDYGARRFRCDDALRAELNAAALKSFDFTHSSFFEFDAALWKVLPTLPLQLNWGRIYERRKLLQQPLIPPVTGETAQEEDSNPELGKKLAPLFDKVTDWFTETHDKEKRAIESTNRKLIFFAEVDSLIADSPEFSSLISRSKELEALLISFCSSPYVSTSDISNYGNDEDWSWIAVGIAQCYLSALTSRGESADDPQDDHDVRLVAHLIALSHLAPIYMLALTSVGRMDPSVFLAVYNFDGGLQNHSPAKAFFPLVIEVNEDVFLDDPPPFRRLESFMSVAAVGFTSNPACFEFFTRCWVECDFHLDYKEKRSFGNEFYFIVDALQFSLLLGKKLKGDLIKYLIDNELSEEQTTSLYEVLREHRYGYFPTVEFAVFVSREVRDIEFNQTDESCGAFANWLVEKSNKFLRTEKMVLRLPFVAKIEEAGDYGLDQKFIRKRAVYYDSVSTLAINLAEVEFAPHHFDTKEGFICFLSAVRSIAASGHREHAAVFLCYALIRACVINKEEIETISVVELDKCVTKDVGEHWASEYLPVVLPYLIADKNTPLDFRLWCESFLRKHKRPIAQVLPFKGFENTKIEAPLAIPIPEWFFEGTASTADALQKVHRALAVEFPSAPQWEKLMGRYGVQDAVGELLRQLEAQLSMFFQEAYDAFYTDNEFKEMYLATTGSDLKPSGYSPSWGWIDYFLWDISVARDVGETAKNLKALRSLANQAKPGLGEVLIAINGRKEIVNSLKKAKQIDNEFTSHNRPIKPPDRVANTRGVVHKKRLSREQVDWVYNYVTVDFGLLFDILHPMISDTDSRETE